MIMAIICSDVFLALEVVSKASSAIVVDSIFAVVVDSIFAVVVDSAFSIPTTVVTQNNNHTHDNAVIPSVLNCSYVTSTFK